MLLRVDLFNRFVLYIQIFHYRVPKRDNLIIMVPMCVNFPCVCGQLIMHGSVCNLYIVTCQNAWERAQPVGSLLKYAEVNVVKLIGIIGLSYA